MRLRFWCLVAASLMVPSLGTPAPPVSKATTLTLGAADWCPYSCPKMNNRGFVAEYISTLLAKHNIRLKVVFLPWNRAIMNANSGKLDGVLTAAIGETPKLALTTIPTTNYRMCLFTNNAGLKGVKLPDTIGKKIGVIDKYSYGEELDAVLRKNKDNLFLLTGQNPLPRMKALLEAKRIDFFAEDEKVTAYTFPGLFHPAVCGKAEPLFLGLNPNMGNTKQLLGLLNREIAGNRGFTPKNHSTFFTQVVNSLRWNIRYTTIAMVAGLLVLTVYLETGYRGEQSAKLARHARVLQNAVWGLNPSEANDYLNLVAERDHYKTIKVYAEPNADVFIHIDGPELSTVDRLLFTIGLVFEKTYVSPIVQNQSVIGRVEVVHFHQTIYTHLYVAVLFGLSWLAFKLFFQTVDSKNLLAQRVYERTRELERSEANFRTLAANMPVVSYRCTLDHDWAMEFMSAEIKRLSGYPPEDFIKNSVRSYDSIIHPDDSQRVFEQVNQAISERRLFELEYRIIDARGEIKWVSERGQGVFANSDSVTTVVGMIMDITENKKLQERLKHSERLESIGRLAGGIAHDFNNMLGAITTSSELLELSLQKKGFEEGRNYIRLIQTAASRSADLIEKLLAFGRRRAGERELISVHAAIQEAVAILNNTTDRRIQINTEFNAGRANITGDEAQIQSIFVNLGINAAQAMPEGGTLTYATRELVLDSAEGTKLPVGVKPGNYLEVTVTDTGSGISEENIESLFEPFFTTKQPGDGTGLGLSVAYGTIIEHGGHIRVGSKLNQGTTFTILLPLSSEHLPDKQLPADIVPGTGRILLVDDEDLVRAAAKHLLLECGYDVLEAVDGRQAVDIYSREGNEIDLVLCDMVMPEMNGQTCYRKLRDINPQIRFVLASGYSPGEAEKSFKEDIAGHIKKPYKNNELSRLIAQILG